MRLQFVLSEMWTGLRRNLTMTAAVVVIIAVSTGGLGMALMFRSGVQKVQYNTLNRVEVSVFLQDNISASEFDSLQKQLRSLRQVKGIQFISKADACKRFKALEPSIAKVAGCSGVPQSFIVHLKNPRDFNVVHSALQGVPGVEDVQNADRLLKRLFSFFHHLVVAAAIGAVALFAVAGLLIYNAIRLSAFSRRRETGIMRLVGASNTFIRLPFVLESVVAGLVGTVVGALALRGMKAFLFDRLAVGILKPFGDIGPFYGALPWMLFVGIVLSGLAAVVTLQRHLRV